MSTPSQPPSVAGRGESPSLRRKRDGQRGSPLRPLRLVASLGLVLVCASTHCPGHKEEGAASASINPHGVVSPFGAGATEGTGEVARVEVTRSGGGSGLASVDWELVEETATAGLDYSSVSGTLTWVAAEEGKQIVELLILDDADVEGDEAFLFTLSNPTGGMTIGSSSTRILIGDDDAPPAGVVYFRSIGLEVTEGAGTFSIAFIDRLGTTGTISVDLVDLGTGTATSGVDYSFTPTTYDWPDGDGGSGFLMLSVLEDADLEGDETIVLGLTNPTGGCAIGTQSTLTITIYDNDTPSTVGFVSTALTPVESDGTALLQVARTGGFGQVASVDVRVVGGSASSGVDYRLASDPVTLSWEAESTNPRSVIVVLLDDILIEPDETVSLVLENPGANTIVGTSDAAVVTIRDDDSPGTLAFDTAASSISESGVNASITVVRSGGRTGAVTVEVGDLVMGTAEGGGTDYDLSPDPTVLAWAAGESGAKSATVTIVDDLVAEMDETAVFFLANPTGGAGLGVRNQTTLTILDDDIASGTLQFDAPMYNVDENAGPATITVTRTGGSGGAATVDVFAGGLGSATGAGGDYTMPMNPVTLSWSDGESGPKSFDVEIHDDMDFEGDEDVHLVLSNATGATLGAPFEATLCISEDDPPPGIAVLAFESAAYPFDEGTFVDVTVVRTGNLNNQVSVDVVVTGGTATGGTDYSLGGTALTFQPTIDRNTVSIFANQDPDFEGDETIELALQNVSVGAVLGNPATSTATILDDDCPPAPGQLQFVAAPYMVSEDVGLFQVRVSRTGGSDGEVSVVYETTPASALPGVDYTGESGTLTWAAGDMSERSFDIEILDNMDADGDRLFGLQLRDFDPMNCGLEGNPTFANVFIDDDETP